MTKTTQITIRISDPEIENALLRKAKESGESLNKVVLELIGESSGTGGGTKNPPGESLRKFAGTMTDEEAAELEDRFASSASRNSDPLQRHVDLRPGDGTRGRNFSPPTITSGRSAGWCALTVDLRNGKSSGFPHSPGR
jgi:hypothetical protein